MTDNSSDLPLRSMPMGMQLTPFDVAFKNDPYSVLRELREKAPALHDSQFNRWVFTRYDDVRELLRDKDMSSDPRKANADSYIGRMAAMRVANDGIAAVPMGQMDDPEHRRIRGLVNKAFTVRAAEAMRPRIREIAESLLAAIGDKEFDVIANFAAPLPAIVIAEMLGIDAKDRASFKYWSETGIAAFFNPRPTPEQTAIAKEAWQDLNAYFMKIIAARRKEPGTDLISAMLRAEEAGDAMTDREVVALCNLLLVAGNVTTTDLIGNGVKALLEHPEQLEKLRALPELLNNAVEEILRYDSPVMGAVRTGQREMTVRGCPIRVGETVSASLAAANHDPEFNPNPERFDIEREHIEHQSFGGGIHTCLGSTLARVEAQEAFAALLARFPTLRPSPRGFQYRSIPNFRGVSQYWVTSDA